MSDETGSVLAGNPAPTVAPDQAAPEVAAWAAEFPADLQGVVANKGWKSPSDAVGSYAHLEKLLGAEKAGRAIVPPKDDASPEEWGAFWGKLGRPETPEGYKLPVPEGDDGTFAQQAAAKFHEFGIPAKQAEGLATWYNEVQAKQAQAQEDAFAQQAGVDLQELKAAWGGKYDAQLELARRAAREGFTAAGIPPDKIPAIERALGVKDAAKLMAFFGQQYQESPLRDGQRSTGFVATPEAAIALLEQRKQDPAWREAFVNGDAQVQAESKRLHAIAYGGGA